MKGICEDFGDLDNAQVLLIAHDPASINSEAQKYSLYADYYFKNDDGSDKDFIKKKELASSAFSLIKDLTDNKFTDEEIYITSLSNTRTKKNGDKDVYIPGSTAQEGIDRIYNILDNSLIQYVFAASTQVNYLLQKLDVYSSKNNFVQAAQPMEQGKYSVPPYYESTNKNALSMICGRIYDMKDRDVKIIPIVNPVLLCSLKHKGQAEIKKNTDNHGKKKKLSASQMGEAKLFDYEKYFDVVRNYFKDIEAL